MDAVLGTVLKHFKNASILETFDKVIALVRVFHVLNDLLDVLTRVEIGDLTVVENVVDILNECFIDDLCVWEQEDMRLTVDTSCAEQSIDHIFTPLFHTVALGHLEAYHLLTSNKSGKLRQTLTSRATHTDEKCITKLSGDDAMNLDDMFNGVGEEH